MSKQYFGTCALCNHRKPVHADNGKGPCKVLGCGCKAFAPKGLLQK